MGRGRQYASERRMFADEVTGVKITQLSGFPTVNSKFYFHVNAFTPDSQTLMFESYKSAQRDSQIDVFKVNTNGMDLVQVTDSPGIVGSVLSFDGKWLYFLVGCEFRRVSMVTYEEELINRLDGLAGKVGSACMTFDDKYYYAGSLLMNGNIGIVRFSTDGKEAGIIHEQPGMAHVQVEPSEGKVVAFQQGPDDQHRITWLVDADGSHIRPLNLSYGNGHWMWLGSTKRIMSNRLPEHRGIYTMKEGDKEAELIADGEHFWHSSSSKDGKWMVSDTNWPDHGIQIINVATKKYKTLCYTGSSSGHAQWSHPHPSFSPDGKFVVYNSDRGGIPHVYIASVPEEMLAELAE